MNYLPRGYKNISGLLKDLRTKPESYWIKRGERNALKLFHDMARRVPAYKDFLKKHKIQPSKIKSIVDFKKLPLIDKDSYLRKYPLKKLCWDGEFASKHWDIAATSGSTGEPFYFPRTNEQNGQYALLAELYLRTNFFIHEKSTLYINAFPLGIWIGGMFTYEALKLIEKTGKYSFSIINPGINKEQIIKAVKKFGNKFDQIIIGCYGPFLKDTIDDGVHQKIDWKQYNLKFVFSAEGFTENFRDYIAKKTNLKNIYLDTLNHYGTVDLGTMSYETPVSVWLRRKALQSPNFYDDLFSVRHKLPTLTQFLPELFYFEDLDGNLVCSANSGIPAVRYDLKDHGHVFSNKSMEDVANYHKIELKKGLREAKIDNTRWPLPFVYVYERSDFSVSLYAFQIYPETIRRALHSPDLEDRVTGKFTMLVSFDKKQNQY